MPSRPSLSEDRAAIEHREPYLTVFAWSPPGDPTRVALAVVALDRSRVHTLAEIFGPDIEHDPAPVRSRPWAWPDAVVVDSPKLVAHDEVRRLFSARHPAAAVILDAVEDTERALELLRAGAAGLLPRDVTPDVLRETVARVLRGEAVIPPAVATEMITRLRAVDGLH